MMGGMKQNLAMIIPNMLQMGWVSYFFAGFVLVKLPFPLTERFKTMMQRGIMLKSLDTSYVSSLSWYFINMFGLRGVFSLVLGSNASIGGEEQLIAQQMAGGPLAGMGGPQAPDVEKIHAAERTELEIIQHDHASVAEAEFRLLGLECPSSKKAKHA